MIIIIIYICKNYKDYNTLCTVCVLEQIFCSNCISVQEEICLRYSMDCFQKSDMNKQFMIKTCWTMRTIFIIINNISKNIKHWFTKLMISKYRCHI